MVAIKTVNLTKKYNDTTAVDNLNLTINKGELFALLGVNGAGKTTTIKMLTNLVKPTSGDAFLFGYSIINQYKSIKQFIGVSPQETSIAYNLSVLENLKFICGIYGFSKEKTNQKIKEITDQFNLNEVLKRKARKLSGGYQRRLSIAMSLISEPKILFLDEPTIGLDVIARHELWQIVQSLKGKVTIVLTTHYLQEAEMLSDKIAIMKDGKLLKIGTVTELKEITNTNNFEDAFISIVKEEN